MYHPVQFVDASSLIHPHCHDHSNPNQMGQIDLGVYDEVALADSLNAPGVIGPQECWVL